jgi:hypothetical protein
MGNKNTIPIKNGLRAHVMVRMLPKYYSSSDTGHVTIFTNETKNMTYHPIQFHTERLTVEIDLPDRVYSDYRLSIWVYANESNGPVSYTRRIGACILTLAGTSIEGKPSCIDVTDNYGTMIGTIRIGLVYLPSHVYILEGKDNEHASLIDRVMKRMDTECKSMVLSYPTTNITEVSNSLFRGVLTPWGGMPSWSFPYLATKPVALDANNTLEAFMNIACYNMGLNLEDIKWDDATTSEMIAEMVSLIPRSCHYTSDVGLREDKRTTSVDDWAFLCHQPSLSMASYDCEDSSLSVMEWSYLLASAKGFTHPVLLRLQAHERRYMTFFCIITLRTSNTEDYGYHVIVLKLDRNWFMSRMRGITTTTDVVLPPVLIDTTTYSTSCWKYRSTVCTEAVYEATSVTHPVEVMGKVPSELQYTRRTMYGHLQSMICPELTRDKARISMIDVMREGKLGATIQHLMEYDKGLEFKCYSTTTEAIEAVDVISRQLMPPVYTSVCTNIQSHLARMRHPRTYKIDGLIRYMDWNREEMARKYNKGDVTYTTLDIVDGLRVIRVRSRT